MKENSGKNDTLKSQESREKSKGRILNAYAVTGQQSGEILLFWEPAAEAVCYAVEYRREDEEKWEQIKLLSVNHLKVDSLDSGTKHYFRIASITVNGPGEWSETISAEINNEF